jgi:NAD-dependent dihydropyrimidine dehydrogenase PreA subunit
MSYIIAEPCVDVKDKSCVEVCPVDCIHGKDEDKMLYINPEECIDCGACEPACPVQAIFPQEEVPEKWKSFIAVNYEYYGQKSPA